MKAYISAATFALAPFALASFVLAPLAQAATPSPSASSANPPASGSGYTNAYTMEEIVVTSSRVPMPLRQVGTSMSVLDAGDIQRQGFNSLFDVLRSQPGIAASNSGGPGKLTALRIRGEENYRTRIYIDGIDISDTSGPQISPRVEQILSANVQRVEILRGPQGLMYGADAGGVINISTRRGEAGFSGVASAEGGRYGTRQVAGDIGGGNDQVDFALSAADYHSDGFNARSDDTALRDDDGYDNTTGHARLGWNASEDLRLELVARHSEGDNEYDNCYDSGIFAYSDRCTSKYEQSAWRASAQYQAGPFNHQLAYTGNDSESQDFTASTPSFGAEGGLDKWSYLGDYQGGDALRLVYGFEHLTESIDDGSFDRDRDQDSYFIEYQGNLADALFVTVGTRYDDNEDFGSQSTYRVSAAYLVPVTGGELKFKGAYGTGFRAPSLYEIAYNNSWAMPPAATVELDAEESAGYDVGVVWAGDNGLYLELNYFDQTISDAIYFDPIAFSGYLQDDGDSTSDGVELVAGIPLAEGLLLTGNYTWNETETADGSTRVRRPEHLANLGIEWQPLGGDLVLGLHLRAARDAIGSDGEPLDDYELVDLNASYALWQGLEVYGRVENLLDEDYQEVRNYNTSGAAAYAGVRYHF